MESFERMKDLWKWLSEWYVVFNLMNEYTEQIIKHEWHKKPPADSVLVH